MTEIETFLKVVNSCFTENQVKILKLALRTGVNVYLYGHGLGKSLLAEAFQNAGYAVSEPGEKYQLGSPVGETSTAL